jgi:hypothetical protein
MDTQPRAYVFSHTATVCVCVLCLMYTHPVPMCLHAMSPPTAPGRPRLALRHDQPLDGPLRGPGSGRGRLLGLVRPKPTSFSSIETDGTDPD